MQFPNHPSRGIGLLELMLSLMVIGVIIVMSMRYYTTARENVKVEQAESMIKNTVTAGYKWLEGAPNFAGVTIGGLVNAGLLPSNYNNGIGVNPWQGNFAINAYAGDSSKLQVTLTNIPVYSCRALAQKLVKFSAIAANSGQLCSSAANGWTFSEIF